MHPMSARLPDDFAYLRDVLDRYAALQFVDEYMRMIDEWDDADLAACTEAHDQILRRKHAAALSAWIHAQPHQELVRPGDARSAFHLFCLFDLLAERAVMPFSQRLIEYCPPRPQLDWSKLPEPIQYLAEPAAEFGVERFEAAIRRLADRLTAVQREQLASLRQRIRQHKHAPVIYHWLRRWPLDQHEEAALVAYMLELMKHAGLPIEDDPEPTRVARAWRRLLALRARRKGRGNGQVT